VRFCFAIAALASVSLHAQTTSFACAPSLPVVLQGETIRLYAWATLPESDKPLYAWTVSSGEVRPTGANVFAWNFVKNSAGTNTADGELRSGSTVQARCIVEVQSIASRTAPVDSGFLTPAGAEADGAGLYNYLLISDTGNQEVSRSALNTWLLLNLPVAELRSILKPNEAISLGLPVLEKPVTTADLEWALQHYDFQRARTLLEKVTPVSKPGIYIISSLQPIAKSRPPYLVQDLSAATPMLAASWVEAFINEAAQERLWNPAEEASLVDQLRTTVMSIAQNLTLPILMKWIALL
jgi:hypothetical protein